MLIPPLILPEILWSTKKLSSSWRQTQIFQNSDFYLKPQLLSLAAKCISAFPLLTLKKMPNTQVYVTSLSVLLWSQKWYSMKKGASSVLNAVTEDNQSCFSIWQNHYEYFLFPHCVLERCIQRPGLKNKFLLLYQLHS